MGTCVMRAQSARPNFTNEKTMNTTSIHAVSKHLNHTPPWHPLSSNSIHHLHPRPDRLVDLSLNTSHKQKELKFLLTYTLYAILHLFHLFIPIITPSQERLLTTICQTRDWNLEFTDTSSIRGFQGLCYLPYIPSIYRIPSSQAIILRYLFSTSTTEDLSESFADSSSNYDSTWTLKSYLYVSYVMYFKQPGKDLSIQYRYN